jgi:hypothetical protein
MKAHVIYLPLSPVLRLHLYLLLLLKPSEILYIPLTVLPLFLNGRLLRNLLTTRVQLLKMRFKIEPLPSRLWSGMTRRWTGMETRCFPNEDLDVDFEQLLQDHAPNPSLAFTV